jgi:hypothetical protein
VTGHDMPDDEPSADPPPDDPWAFPPPPAGWGQAHDGPPAALPPWAAPPAQPQAENVEAPYDPGETRFDESDPWRIPPQPRWDPAHEPPPSQQTVTGVPAPESARGGPAPTYRTPEPPDQAFPPPAEPPATVFDLPPSATSPRSTPRPPVGSQQDARAPGASANVRFDEPWRRESPVGRRRAVRPRTLLAAVAGIAVVALIVGGVFLLRAESPKRTPPAGPPAQLAGRLFAADPGATTDGRDQSLTGIATNGSTVVAIGGENDGVSFRPEFLVSADAGRSFRLAAVRTLSGDEPPYGDAPKQIVAGNGAWVALGTRPNGTTVWTSRDGRGWVRQPDAAGTAFGGNDRVGRVVALGSGFLAVGSTSAKGDFTDPTPVVWRSADGRRWDRLTGGQLNFPSAGGTLTLVGAAARGETVVAHGVGRGPKPHPKPIDGLWRSNDGGRTWEAVTVPSPGGAGGYGIAATPAGLFIAREAEDKSGRYAAVYASVDSSTWTAAGQIRLPGYRRLLRFNGSSSGLAALAGTGRDATLVHSTDGRSWQSAGNVSLSSERILADVAQTPGQTVLVGRDNTGTDADPMMVVRDGQGQDVRAPLGSAGAVQPDQAVEAVGTANRLIVAVGSSNGDPAVWHSADGRSWQRAQTTTRAGMQRLTSVTGGLAGWLAVGQDGTAPRHPLVLTSRDGSSWQRTDGAAVFRAKGDSALTTYAAAMGPAGYVVVGEDGFSAASWFSPDLKSWERGTAPDRKALKGTDTTGRWMHDVAGGPSGYVAVGGLNDPTAHGAKPSRPAVWTSADGRRWTLRQLPLPGGSVGAWFDHVSAKGSVVVASGTASVPSGSRAFAFLSVDGGRSWQQVSLPTGDDTSAAVDTSSSTPKGFVIAGTTGQPGSADVVMWTSADGRTWTASRPRGTGLSGRGDQKLTGLTAVGTDLLGVGVTADHTGRQPTLWHRPPA